MLKRTLPYLVIVLSMVTFGCTTTQKYMAGGATLGAVTGGVWAHNTGVLDAGEGAAVGAAAGAALGALVGDLVDEADTKELIAERDALLKQVADLQEENRRLQQELANCRNRPTPEAEVRTEHMSFNLLSDVLFNSGKATLRAEGKDVLNRVAARLKSDYADQKIMVMGHTDSQPIVYSGWTDNWELGAARSLAVLRYLVSQGVQPERLSASTHSQYEPVASNDTAEGRQQNRRSVIAIHEGIRTTHIDIQ